MREEKEVTAETTLAAGRAERFRVEPLMIRIWLLVAHWLGPFLENFVDEAAEAGVPGCGGDRKCDVSIGHQRKMQRAHRAHSCSDETNDDYSR